MPTAYKLTRKDRSTYNGFIWPAPDDADPWVETSGKGLLCSEGWLHFYTSPLLAALLNPIHGDLPADDCIGWEAEVDGDRLDDHGLKVGYTRARLVRRIELPELTIEDRIRCAIAWARAAQPAPKWAAVAALRAAYAATVAWTPRVSGGVATFDLHAIAEAALKSC